MLFIYLVFIHVITWKQNFLKAGLAVYEESECSKGE
jgi:hypothetical protein